MKLDDFYYVGKITKKFSFRGEVIIFLDTDSPEFYYNIKKFYIKLNDVLTPLISLASFQIKLTELE